MKILVACEESQTVTKAFRNLGHEAYSCDTEPCSGGHPEWHLQQDVIHLLQERWDMIIAHPPCTFLTNTGNAWFFDPKTKTEPHPKYPNRRLDQQDAVKFFLEFPKANSPKICIENPIGYMNTHYRKPDQIVHPNWFGHDASKATCLWLFGLPNLLPTNIVEVTKTQTSTGKKYDQWYWDTSKLKGKERSKIRSKTFQGVADAMANQWGV
jgi:hypothetical protein